MYCIYGDKLKMRKDKGKLYKKEGMNMFEKEREFVRKEP
jgi:hypothetical protein